LRLVLIMVAVGVLVAGASACGEPTQPASPSPSQSGWASVWSGAGTLDPKAWVRGERFRLTAGPVRVRLVQETPTGEQVALGLELVPLAPAAARNQASAGTSRGVPSEDGRSMVTEFRTTRDVLAGTYCLELRGTGRYTVTVYSATSP
jgi:hypothetical protein